MYVSGVTGGLYYVRNGTVNDYALTFNLPLRPDITDIYFSWNASASQSPVKHTRCMPLRALALRRQTETNNVKLSCGEVENFKNSF